MKRRANSWTLPLPQTAEYALRALAHIATLPPDQPIRAQDLSKATSVPVHYLSKVMRRLVTARLVHAQKGHGGGFVLAHPPEKITLGAVLAAGDYNDAESDRCAFGWGTCDVKQPCPLHGCWSQLKEGVQRWSQTMTLADIRDYAASVDARRSGRATRSGRALVPLRTTARPRANPDDES